MHFRNEEFYLKEVFINPSCIPPPHKIRRRGFASAGSFPLLFLFLALFLAAAQTTLTSNTGQIVGTTNAIIGSFGSNRWNLALGFTTGGNAGDYTLSAVDVKIKLIGDRAITRLFCCPIRRKG